MGARRIIELEKISQTILGSFDEGIAVSAATGNSGASTYHKTSVFIVEKVDSIKARFVKSTSIQKLGIAFYNREGVFISGEYFTDIDDGEEQEVSVPQEAYIAKYTYYTDARADQLSVPKTNSVTCYRYIQNIVQQIENNTDYQQLVYLKFTIQKAVSAITGESKYTAYHKTSVFIVDKVDIIKAIFINANSNIPYGIAFYNREGVFISGEYFTDIDDGEEQEVSVPQEAYTAKYTYYTDARADQLSVPKTDSVTCYLAINNAVQRLANNVMYQPEINTTIIYPEVDYNFELNEVLEYNSDKEYIGYDKIGPFSYDFKFVGAVMGYNGKIYGITNSSRQVLEIDPVTNMYSTFGTLPEGDFKWTGGVVGPDGRIYGLPRRSNSILIIDPMRRIAYTKSLGTTYGNTTDHHYGGTIYQNKIYLCPLGAKHILVIDINDFSTYRIGEGIITSGYQGCILHPNGYIYMFSPSGNSILKINPKNDEYEFIDKNIQISVTGLVVHPYDSNIYGFSGTVAGIFKFDPTTNESELLHTDVVNGGYYGIKLGINGKLYSVLGNSTSLVEYDVISDSVKVVSKITDAGYDDAKCAGGMLAQNGNIYMIPAKGRYIYVLKFTESLRQVPMNILCSPYISNY